MYSDLTHRGPALIIGDGDTASAVSELVRLLRAKVEAATESGAMSMEEGADMVRTFVRGLDDYTYLTR